MSVAFRRESDEEHKEPKFERPILPGPNLVTARGLALIEGQIVALDAALEDAAGEGAEAIRRDLRYWHTRRTTAVPTTAPADRSIGIGTRATIRLSGKQRVIEIVGDDEADPAADRIGHSAPLARALMGAEPGEVLDFHGRVGAIEVLAVRELD